MKKSISSKRGGKYWLKGMLIGVGVGIFLYFLGWIMEYSFISNIINYRIRYLISSPMCDPRLFPFITNDAEAPICFVIFGIPFNILFYGIVGLIIGWIYGAIKRSKNGKE